MAYGQNPFQMGLARDNQGGPRMGGTPAPQAPNPDLANMMASLLGGYTGGGGMAPGRGAVAPTGLPTTMTGRLPIGPTSATTGPAPSGAMVTSSGGKDLSGVRPLASTTPTAASSQQDWQNYGKNQWNSYWEWLSTQKGGLPANANLDSFLRDFGAKGFTGLMPFAGISSNLGGATLAQLLASQGATDPRLMNQQISGIERGTQSQQQGVQGELARRGLGASGIGQALSASVGQAGEGRIADLRAKEAQTQEQRKRDDLGLLMQMILQPSTDAAALHFGQYQANAARGQQNKGAQLAALASIIAAVACWAAEEVFHNPQDEDAVRTYMATHPDLLNAYLISGKDLAYEIKHNESVRRVIVPRFHEFAEVGYELVS